MNGSLRVRVAGDAAALAREAGRLIVETVAAAVTARGRALVALAGGSTPRGAYSWLPATAGDPFPWERVLFLAGDERDVPRDHADRNERMFREAFLDRVPAAAGRLLEWPVGLGSSDEVASRMEADIRRVSASPPGTVPVFDLVLLGLGSDGHTASLFPGSPALDERSRIAVANPVPSLGATRYTLTFPVIEAASRVVFLVAGAEKAGVAARVLAEGPASGFPAGRARSRDGETVWILDRPAASRLPEDRDPGRNDPSPPA
jgi:6-phosphogluconolactonase